MPEAESSVVPESAAKSGVVDEADSAGAVRDGPSVGSSPLVISNSEVVKIGGVERGGLCGMEYEPKSQREFHVVSA